MAVRVRDLKSGGKRRGRTRKARLGAGLSSGGCGPSQRGGTGTGGGGGRDGSPTSPPSALQEDCSSPGPHSGAHPIPDTPGACHHCGACS